MFDRRQAEASPPMAYHTEAINPDAKTMQQELLDRHYLRKHGKNAYYGQK